MRAGGAVDLDAPMVRGLRVHNHSLVALLMFSPVLVIGPVFLGLGPWAFLLVPAAVALVIRSTIVSFDLLPVEDLGALSEAGLREIIADSLEFTHRTVVGVSGLLAFAMLAQLSTTLSALGSVTALVLMLGAVFGAGAVLWSGHRYGEGLLSFAAEARVKARIREAHKRQ